eukprot:c7999_g1_i1.p1 GENE.c7999_g1_i1~~c7999_g1_i1.p1  ORF type:complete len:280 (+),score=104.22 c7999_g1_i1:27-866(+)
MEKEEMEEEEKEEEEVILMSPEKESLSILLEQQLRERTQSHQVCCLFCRKEFTGPWSTLFLHMLNEHGFHPGRLDNMINIESFLEFLREKLNRFECIYCKKTFPSWDVLKKHLRKKKHFRIPPNDTEFDKFYLINHVDGVHWKDLQNESDEDSELDPSKNNEDDWNEWVVTKEDGVNEIAECLFCDFKFEGGAFPCIEHMKLVHNFDIQKTFISLNLDDYGVIRYINYSRLKKISLKKPISNTSQILPSSVKEFNDEKYLKPVLEDDGLLTFDYFSDSN